MKVYWVCSAQGMSTDQLLEDCEVGPLIVGANEFDVEHSAPDWRRLPPADLVQAAVILFTWQYEGQEFLRVGHYVNTSYQAPPGAPPAFHIGFLLRNVLVERPDIVTKCIDWDTPIWDDSLMSSMAHTNSKPSARGGVCAEADDCMAEDDTSRSRAEEFARQASSTTLQDFRDREPPQAAPAPMVTEVITWPPRQVLVCPNTPPGQQYGGVSPQGTPGAHQFTLTPVQWAPPRF
eukprot:TRINITY_DN8036_c1_g1_i1.p1 TRINITY_DN8036_c1_g1~~TRINITY_DN8036_c1_g1_i1.p1  ORF type:complete len:234 (+),score=75.03 TRINITY_DN8036_c1_g1_i1:176-877(+)